MRSGRSETLVKTVPKPPRSALGKVLAGLFRPQLISSMTRTTTFRWLEALDDKIEPEPSWQARFVPNEMKATHAVNDSIWNPAANSAPKDALHTTRGPGLSHGLKRGLCRPIERDCGHSPVTCVGGGQGTPLAISALSMVRLMVWR